MDEYRGVTDGGRPGKLFDKKDETSSVRRSTAMLLGQDGPGTRVGVGRDTTTYTIIKIFCYIISRCLSLF